MVDGERGLAFAAIHALETVAAEDILAGEFDLFERHAQVGAQADDAGVGIGVADRPHSDRRAMLDHFGLRQEQEQEGLFGAADADGLIRLVEDQYLGIERRRGVRRLAEGFCVYVNSVFAEGNTSLTLK